MAQLEQRILDWTEQDLVSESLQWRDFIEIELKESIFQIKHQEKRRTFQSSIPYAHDDSAVISQLEMDALCLSIALMVKRQEYGLSPVEEEHSVREDEAS